MSKLIAIWAAGLGVMFVLYFAGNPFGIYDDIVIIAVLVAITVKMKSNAKRR